MPISESQRKVNGRSCAGLCQIRTPCEFRARWRTMGGEFFFNLGSANGAAASGCGLGSNLGPIFCAEILEDLYAAIV